MDSISLITGLVSIVLAGGGVFYAREQLKVSKNEKAPPPKEDDAGSPATRYHLPAMGTVIGRASQIAATRDLWLKGNRQPLLIWGGPGIGKTTLARSILRDPFVAMRFGDRRYEIQCDTIQTPEELIIAMAREWFAIALSAPQAMKAELLEHIKEAPCAILIDNFETLCLTPSPTQISQCVHDLAQILGCETAWVMVGTMGRQKPAGLSWLGPIEPGNLDDASARELFCLESGNPRHMKDPNLGALIKSVDYIPQAIKLLGALASAYADLAPVMRIWEEKGTELFPPAMGRTREQTLTVAYDVCVSSLKPETLRALKLLACIPAGIADSDIEAVLPGGLLQGSLLHAAALLTTEDLPPRRRIPSPMRRYIQKAFPPDTADLETAVSHYLDIVAKTSSTTCTGEMALRIAREWPNIIWALRKGHATHHPATTKAAVGAARFSEVNGLGREECESLWSELKAGTPENAGQDDDGEALGIHTVAGMARWKFDFERSEKLYHKAISLYRPLGNKDGEAWCVWGLGEIARLTFHYDAARKYYLEAADLFAEIGGGTRDGTAWAQWGIAETYRLEADDGDGRSFYQQDGRKARWLDARTSQDNAADLAVAGHKTAKDYYERALALFQTAQNLQGIGCCFASLADSARVCFALHTALTYYSNAIDAFTRAEYAYGMAWSLEGRGDIYKGLNKPLKAHSDWTSAVSIWTKETDDSLKARLNQKIRAAQNSRP